MYCSPTPEFVHFLADVRPCTCALLQANIERDMLSMFRKGSEWESGIELLLVLQPTSGDQAGIDSAYAFTERLATFAQDSRSTALQATVGTVLRRTRQQQVCTVIAACHCMQALTPLYSPVACPAAGAVYLFATNSSVSLNLLQP